MDKLKALLGKLGASSDLTESICSELAKYESRVDAANKVKYENDLKAKLTKAKQVCLEEITKEKAELARKVGVFLEAKEKQIQQACLKARAIEEAEAKAILRRAKAVLEGIELKDDGSVKDFQALEKKLSRMEKAFLTVKEERDMAVGRLNKATSIATEALKQSNMLEEKVKAFETKGPVAEAKKLTAPAVSPAKPKVAPRRLDEGRIVAEAPKTTRRPITETAVKPASGMSSGASDPISQIAMAIDN